ncbi:carbohydrate-binding module family 18 protein [Xylaria sp. CBS 124048]|nr:carbohydrate-binding module family 18 protein [Xylaria sp. CBS 124048]
MDKLSIIMHFPTRLTWTKALAFTTLLCNVQAFRNVVYIDEWHPNITTANNNTADITHVIMAFVDPLNFTTKEHLPTPPLMPVEQVRSHFDNGTKVGIALGGWGRWSTNFALVAAEENRTAFACNLATWMKNEGYDFVDIDWEYPGGNGAETATNPGKEITDFPLMISAIKTELKNQSVGIQNISLSVAGTPTGMSAFQSVNQTRPIWDNVDFINIMAYDYVNRGSNATGHHSDVEGTKLAVSRYIDLGLDPEKINLGFAFYAKYFQVNGTCENFLLPAGCPIIPAQSANGTDLYTSGVLTFEYSNLPNITVDKGALPETTDGTCGYFNGSLTGRKCTQSFCCSEDGWCGDQPAHCLLNCQANYGTCQGPDTVESFAKARTFGEYDTIRGGAWFYDESTTPKLFWTWETPDTMLRKFNEIVNNSTAMLGGIAGWSFGEDTISFEHVKQMQNMTRMRKAGQPSQCFRP